jgi:hypothetical protein
LANRYGHGIVAWGRRVTNPATLGTDKKAALLFLFHTHLEHRNLKERMPLFLSFGSHNHTTSNFATAELTRVELNLKGMFILS